MKVVLHNKGRSLGVESIGVFLHQRLGEIIDMQSESVVQKFNDLKALLCFFPHASGLATKIPCQSQGCQRDCRWRVFHIFPVKKCDFHDESSDMLNLLIFHGRTTTQKSEPCFCGRMSKSPLYSREHMAFHLNERRLFVGLTAYLD